MKNEYREIIKKIDNWFKEGNEELTLRQYCLFWEEVLK